MSDLDPSQMHDIKKMLQNNALFIKKVTEMVDKNHGKIKQSELDRRLICGKCMMSDFFIKDGLCVECQNRKYQNG